jgi:N-methylhydantoinase A/oxoprolinase/acetone carboxylase beta subunit
MRQVGTDIGGIFTDIVAIGPDETRIGPTFDRRRTDGQHSRWLNGKMLA